MEVDAHQSAVVESGTREGAGRRDASTEREVVEGRILTIVARQVCRVLRCVCLLCVIGALIEP
jgi:hypothetical protein